MISYKEKVITVKEALEVVKSDFQIITGLGGGGSEALYSIAMVKNPQIRVKEETSKIVPFLKQGAIVSLSRNDVDMVVTE